MDRRVLAIAGVVAVVIVAGAFVLPDEPGAAEVEGAPDSEAGDGDSGGDASDGGSSGGSTPLVTVSGGGATTTEKPFAFTVDEIEQCGSTCRDVTTSLTNQQSTDASGVDATTDIYAGNQTDGDSIWSGEESIGTLPAGESDTVTKRVDLGMSDALAVEQNDGWITIETTIESDSKTMTIVQHRNVN
jgi:hypothetical protein